MAVNVSPTLQLLNWHTETPICICACHFRKGGSAGKPGTLRQDLACKESHWKTSTQVNTTQRAIFKGYVRSTLLQNVFLKIKKKKKERQMSQINLQVLVFRQSRTASPKRGWLRELQNTVGWIPWYKAVHISVYWDRSCKRQIRCLWSTYIIRSIHLCKTNSHMTILPVGLGYLKWLEDCTGISGAL